MVKTYQPKKIEVIWEQVDKSPEEIQARLDDAFDFLFEETLKYLQTQKIENNSITNSQIGKEVIQDERLGQSRRWSNLGLHQR